jgi:hypothetical protein
MLKIVTLWTLVFCDMKQCPTVSSLGDERPINRRMILDKDKSFFIFSKAPRAVLTSINSLIQ